MLHPKMRLLSPELPKPGNRVLLSQHESNHAVRVLRLKDGDSVLALNGKGQQQLVQLRIFENQQVYLEALVEGPSASAGTFLEDQMNLAQSYRIILELGLLKGQAMEWAIEKAVELGVTECIPVVCARSVVKISSKGPAFFQERWQKIANQALKQCGRLNAMRIHLPISFPELVQQPLLSGEMRCWCDEQRPASIPFLMDWLAFHTLHFSAGLRILVGPEGGWDPCERESLLSLKKEQYPVSLGHFTLRAETAAVFCASLATAAVHTHLVHSHRKSNETRP